MARDTCFVGVEWDDSKREATIEASDNQRMVLTYHEVSLLMHELVDRCGDSDTSSTAAKVILGSQARSSSIPRASTHSTPHSFDDGQ